MTHPTGHHPAGEGLVAYINARVLDPASGLDSPGAVLTNGRVIADVGPDLFRNGVPSGIAVVDCQGLCLAPGLVDIRVQIREPGEEYKENFRSAGQAAVAGGVTTMVCLPNTQPPIDDMAAVEFVASRAAKVGLTKVYAYAGITRGMAGKDLTEMGLLAEAGAVGFTDGVRAVGDSRTMLRALSYAATFGVPVIQHPEDPSLGAGGQMNRGELATRLGLSGIPTAAEAIMLERDLRLVAMTGARYHAAHISTADGVDIIRRAKADGLPVTCDTAPPYFTLNELAVGDWRTFAKLSPPLRTEADRLAIVQGLKDGVIDAIASDHAPQDAESKRLPFAQAAFGGIGLETLLAASLGLVHSHAMPLLAMLKPLTCGPADLLGLPAGRLTVDSPADLVIFDPNRPWVVDSDQFLSKSNNSPFDDMPLTGLPLWTVIEGRVVYQRDGE